MDGLGLYEVREGRLLAQFGKAVGDATRGTSGRGDEANLGGRKFAGGDGVLEQRIERVGLTGTRTTGQDHERTLGETLQGVGLLWIQTIGRGDILGGG